MAYCCCIWAVAAQFPDLTEFIIDLELQRNILEYKMRRRENVPEEFRLM